jgi:hypothetical protein
VRGRLPRRAGHLDKQHARVGVVAAFVQPEQDGDGDIGGRPPGTAFLSPDEVIDVRLEDAQGSSLSRIDGYRSAGRSARSVAVISSASS